MRAGNFGRVYQAQSSARGRCPAGRDGVALASSPRVPQVSNRLRLCEDVPAHPSSYPTIDEIYSSPTALPSERCSFSDPSEVGTSLPVLQAGPIYDAQTLMGMNATDFKVQLDESPPPPGKERSPDYYANVGDAIRTLREDIPVLFYKELNCEWFLMPISPYSNGQMTVTPHATLSVSFFCKLFTVFMHVADEIYREDIVFRDPSLHFKGLKNYKLIFWSLRFHGRLFFSRLLVDVLRIWQPEDHQIKLRWRVHGIPRVWWEAEGTLDGVSTYKLDSDGRIYEHMVDNVQLRDPPITNPALYGLNYVLAPRLQPQPQPCPGSWFTEEDYELAMHSCDDAQVAP